MSRFSPTETPRRRPFVLGCIGGALLLALGASLWLVWLLEVPSPGVRIGAEVPAYVFELVEVEGLLEKGETVRAFYDRSRELSGTSAVLVTDRRLLAWDAGGRRSVTWRSGERVTGQVAESGGWRFEVSAGGSSRWRFEVAPGHGGERLAAVLESLQSSPAGSSNRLAG
ncbi:MAG: hypothetical protein AAF604_20045 [Acidobacteriota bacterium]